MHMDPRTEFHRARICATPHGLVAHSTGGQRSSRVTSLSGANGLVVVPPKVDGKKTALVKGELADAILIGEIQV
jgi:gephyrin